MWIKKLKVAVVQKDTDTLNELLDEVPNLVDINDIEQVLYLLKEATQTLNSLKEETASSMKKIKKNLDFLKSTQEQTTGSLDIIS